MVETFTPAVCGSRRRQRAAVALFTLGAVLAAAALGALLGLAGGALGARQAVLAAGALALVAAAREAGLVRVPLPQARRQVPERWRFELPLPLWATGYGAGLGVGVFTYQPVSTFWIACAGGLALARPAPAALCLSFYGAGRAATLLWARTRREGAGEAVERLAGRRRALLRANAVALAACATLLFLAPSAGAKGVRVGPGYDPTLSKGIVGYARANGTVVLRTPGKPEVVVPGARAPSLDGIYLAHTDANGIRIIDWRTQTEVRRLPGPVSAPALDWPLVAFRREGPGSRRLVLRNLLNDAERLIATTKKSTDLGRPSLRNGWIAWHTASRTESRIVLYRISNRSRRIVERTKIGRLANPSLHPPRLLWVDERSGSARLELGFMNRKKVRLLARIRSRSTSFWTTALGYRVAYATRWSLRTRGATVFRIRY
jgi:hypothetical protein